MSAEGAGPSVGGGEQPESDVYQEALDFLRGHVNSRYRSKDPRSYGNPNYEAELRARDERSLAAEAEQRRREAERAPAVEEDDRALPLTSWPEIEAAAKAVDLNAIGLTPIRCVSALLGALYRTPGAWRSSSRKRRKRSGTHGGGRDNLATDGALGK